MDGDRAPLRELVELKKRFDALLMLDEAHAVGVIGPNGRGLAAAENVSEEVDIQMGTLSKALGDQRRLHLRFALTYRMADQSRPFLHLFHCAATGNRGSRPRRS